MNYASHVSRKQTPQSEPIPGTTQVENSAGGFTWAVDDWTRLDRFLILGSEGATYYASEKALTRANAAAVERLLKTDGPRVVARAVELSIAGRAPKNDPAIFVLALALKTGDPGTRARAAMAVPRICRIGTHLFQLAAAVDELGGWGRGTKRAFADWYLTQTPDELALQLAKYQSRNGWSHRDVLRKAHAKPKAPEVNRLLRWAVGKPNEEAIGGLIGAFEDAKKISFAAGFLPSITKREHPLPKAALADMAKLITDHNLPRECVPTEFLNAPEVWDALLHAGKYGMPMTAMIRNLGKMSAIELAKPLSDATKFICDRLRDREALKAARVHPIQLLLALRVYGQGRGDKGSLTWSPAQEIIAALDDAFHLSFANVEPTGKRFVLALDVSGSMGQGSVAGSGLTPREASAAMALVTAKTEQRVYVVGFTASATGGRYGGMHDSGQATLTAIPGINARASLTEAVRAVSSLPFGGTDCALPMLVAEKEKLDVDAFVILTDNETWAGHIHPAQALRSYRQARGIDAKVVVMGMTATEFTIADPNDKGMLDVVGFDANVPAIMSDFVKGGA